MIELKVLTKAEVLEKIDNDDVKDLACIDLELNTCWVESNTVGRFLEKLNHKEDILFFTIKEEEGDDVEDGDNIQDGAPIVDSND